MADLLKIFLVFAVIIILLRLKWNVGYVMTVASGLVFVFYLAPLPVVVRTVMNTATDVVVLNLLLSLGLIRVFEIVLREKQVLLKMTEASRVFLKKKKAVIISMPMLIGLLPSLGGAYFSAPMVDEATKGLNMSPEQKGFINYWFRHPWEYVLPLYPGILLASAISGIELRSLIFVNSIYAVLVIATGFLFGLRKVKGNFYEYPGTTDGRDLRHGAAPERADGRRQLLSFLPVAAVLFMVIVLRLGLHYALGITVSALFFFYRVGLKDIFRFLRHGFASEIIVLIFGTMLFKFAMENSMAVDRLSGYFSGAGIPFFLVIFILPFVSGLLTGLTMASVGSTFPLIINLAGGAHLNQLSFAFVAGYAGVLLSPVHLCLILTREYFNADMRGLYKKIVPSCLIIAGTALLIYLWADAF